MSTQPSGWLTKAQICMLTGWHPRHIERKVASGEIIARDTKRQAANGRSLKEYAAASLPEAVRAKLDTPRPTPDACGDTGNAGLMPLFQDRPGQGNVREGQRVALTPEAQRVAEERLGIIRPLLDFIADPSERSRFVVLVTRDGKKVTTSNLLVQYLSEQHKVSARTIWNWKKAFGEQGLAGLARGIRSDKGKSRFFAQNPHAAQLVASVYLKPYQTAASAYDTLLREHQILDIPACELPSYGTVRAYLDSLPPSITVLARKGERAYSERMSPYVQRGYEDVEANQIWVADHMIHDVEVRNDCFEGVPENAPMRLRFSGFLDMRTRKFMGYCWAPEGNSRVIITAIRRGVERYGLPETVYCDNGKDYRKVAKGARAVTSEWTEAEYEALSRTGVLQRLGIAVQYCMPYHAQSKLIERAFRTFHLKFDALFPHYTTGNAYLRPDQTTVAMTEHRKLLKMDRGAQSPLVPASHFIRMASVWIEQDYNARHAHSGKGMDGRTPDAVFTELASAHRAADPAILSQLLWENQKRRVRECAVTLNNRRYVAADPQSSATLHLANETEVLICYDPHDLEHAVIADLDGRQIARVQSELLLPHSAEAAPAIRASMIERRRLRKATVSTVRQIHHNVAMMGHKSDLELLHERALPAAVGDSIVHRMTEKAESTAPSAPRYSHDIAAEFLSEEV